MRKVSLLFAMILLIAGASVRAQNKGFDQQFDREFDITVQDDETGNILVFNSKTGDYTFTRCGDGITMAGRGQVTRKGCSVDLVDIGAPSKDSRTDSYKVLVSADECTKEAKGAVEIYEWLKGDSGPIPPMKESLRDSDMTNSASSCFNPAPTK